MKFRPCIDIHNGKVKQIVGGSLSGPEEKARENFVSEKNGDYYAKLYREKGALGGHVILLNPSGSPYYEETKSQALLALHAFPGGLQLGGGVTEDNARFWLEAGASHVIVTSRVFRDGRIDKEALARLEDAVGRDRLVLDVSCRRRRDGYYIVTDRWQRFTNVKVGRETLEELKEHCAEFLVHGVDVEGKACGVDRTLLSLLAAECRHPVTYAGGVGSYDDLSVIREAGEGRIDFTVGSALDIFGGSLSFDRILKAYPPT